ncbi:hypothetical protein M426DRAFT_318278 [Hypoxylon sp. CI-4A]|nr:hypothetical protein M426DRAFT_318278 [Hypoxylon sp. CI-4A]
MIVTTTATTTAAATQMSLSSNLEASTTPHPFKGPMDSPDTAMEPFTPGQCLFCSNLLSSFSDSVAHMQKSHGLFIPYQQHLVIDLETLFRYLHLVIFGYRECIQCGTERTTVQAVRQHMTSKGHCKFDISEEDSEFAEFYDFTKSGYNMESDIEDDGGEGNQQGAAATSNRQPILTDQDSIRLPSGKLISKQSSAHAGSSLTQLRRRAQTSDLRLDYSPEEPDKDEGSIKQEPGSDVRDTRILSKREKRERATATYQLASMSASDRNSLVHLSPAQQYSILATQHRHAEKVQKEERRRRGRIDQKGNKNLYAYWHTETPVFQCG